jgi:hypothetical protein
MIYSCIGNLIYSTNIRNTRMIFNNFFYLFSLERFTKPTIPTLLNRHRKTFCNFFHFIPFLSLILKNGQSISGIDILNLFQVQPRFLSLKETVFKPFITLSSKPVYIILSTYMNSLLIQSQSFRCYESSNLSTKLTFGIKVYPLLFSTLYMTYDFCYNV